MGVKLILDPARSRCMLMELKHVERESDLGGAVSEASSQIVEKKYESRLIYEGYTTRLRYALAFWEKRVVIERLGGYNL